MGIHIYKKTKRINVRKIARFTGLIMALTGLLFGLYILSPLLSWELYLKPAFASNFASPIPQTTVLTKDTIQSLLKTSFYGSDWLPVGYENNHTETKIPGYSFSIPKLQITDAEVSTTDTDISLHLVHFPGTAMPPTKGNAVIFGHSTLPQLYDPQNYKTIFANVHNLKIDDTFIVTIDNTQYTYKIVSITIVDAEDTSYLVQPTDHSYLTVVTCTPPGTIWKRLILKSRLEKING